MVKEKGRSGRICLRLFLGDISSSDDLTETQKNRTRERTTSKFAERARMRSSPHAVNFTSCSASPHVLSLLVRDVNGKVPLAKGAASSPSIGNACASVSSFHSSGLAVSLAVEASRRLGSFLSSKTDPHPPGTVTRGRHTDCRALCECPAAFLAQ